MSSSSPRTEPIRGVSFDVGGTLIEATPSVGAIYAAVCREHGIEVPAGECDRLFEKAWYRRSADLLPGRDRFSSAPGGEDGWWRGVVLEVLAGCGVPARAAPPIGAFRGAFASPSAWSVFEDVPATLAALRRSGYRIAVLSNWDSRLPELLRMLGLSRFFDSVICSALERVEKPDPRIFRRAGEALRLPVSEILHVGDDPGTDYHGALAAGMPALWINRGGGRANGPAVRPDHIVTSVGQVAARLDGARGAPERGQLP